MLQSGYPCGDHNVCGEASVPDFRYYCLNEEDRIVLGSHLIATDLPAAIREAYDACRHHPHFASNRIEVWQGSNKLYATGFVCDGGASARH